MTPQTRDRRGIVEIPYCKACGYTPFADDAQVVLDLTVVDTFCGDEVVCDRCISTLAGLVREKIVIPRYMRDTINDSNVN